MTHLRFGWAMMVVAKTAYVHASDDNLALHHFMGTCHCLYFHLATSATEHSSHFLINCLKNFQIYEKLKMRTATLYLTPILDGALSFVMFPKSVLTS